jgi:hypothetical protein
MLLLISFPAITLNIGADIEGMAAVCLGYPWSAILDLFGGDHGQPAFCDHQVPLSENCDDIKMALPVPAPL